MTDHTPDHPAATDADVRNAVQHYETLDALDRLTTLYADLVSVVADLRDRVERIESK
ncbi:MAG: hypothetical protein INR66_12745 [Gordonia polyisoprenivorans]|nr:hypothetical protein [Gordonia polyisoprenivorans]